MASSRQFAQHVRVSSTEQLSYSSSTKEEINETIQTIVTGRKCWKTMKGKGEVVWPPYLEAALVEGLEKYQPVESRTARAFGRFPMRNKFISDYIFNTTGKRRTPKQVGSRLQQLRDTAEGKRILQLLSSRHIAMMQPKESAKVPTASPGQPEVPGLPASAPATPVLPPVNHVTIDVAPDNGLPQPANLTPLYGAGPSSSTAPQPTGPRTLRSIDPTVTFMSHTPLSACSSFRVLRGETRVHAERTELELCSTSCMPGQGWGGSIETKFLYKTAFVPQFWQHLCDARDPTQYVIVQDIVRSPPAGLPSQTPVEDVLLSVVYRFSTPATSPPLSPQASSFGDADRSSYSSRSSPELSTDFDDLLMYSSLENPAPHSTATGSHGSYTSLHGTPPLIHRDEEGYNSVPPSPLDLQHPGDWKYHGAAMPAISHNTHLAPLCGGSSYPNFLNAPAVFDGAHLPSYNFTDMYHA